MKRTPPQAHAVILVPFPPYACFQKTTATVLHKILLYV